MSTYPPSPEGQPDPYGRPQQPYGQPNNPYGNPYGDPYGNPQGPPPQQPYGRPQQPPGQPNDPYGNPYGNPYGRPQQPPADPGPRPAPGPQPANPYEELGRLSGDYGPPGPVRTPDPTAPPQSFGAEPPAPRRRRKLLGCLGVVGVLVLAVGGVFAYLVVKDVSAMGQYKLSTPSSFQGLASDPSNSLVTQIAGDTRDIASMGATPVSAAYSTHVGDRLPQLILVGGYGNVADPAKQLDSLWSGFTGTGATLSGKTDEAAGPLGGSAQCAVAVQQGTQMPVCAWADSSTVAMVLFSGQASMNAIHPDMTALGQRLVEFRGAVEVKK